ncbi:hypothetical protein B0H16DRAFT_1893621 [Mycena metata]|uniref:Uncharacterized protein n=1 Tax=Mycena metata TaxID=1033252 RepID=A0AAD7HX18_9AGAR|nr:hypothetical protein B0H16DRAFT_1893621 [Mycena metata]
MVQPMRRGACIQHPWNVSICAEAEVSPNFRHIRKPSPHWIPTLAPIDRDPATAYSFTTLSAPFPNRRSPKQTVCFVGVAVAGRREARQTNWVGNPAFLAPVSLSFPCCTYACMPTEVIDSKPVFPTLSNTGSVVYVRRQRARVPAATYSPCAHLTEYGAPTFTLSMDIDGLSSLEIGSRVKVRADSDSLAAL